MITFGVSVALGAAAGVLALTLAILVLWAAPERPVNRLLALSLFTEAIAQSGARILFVLPFPLDTLLWYLTPMAVGILPFVYLLLLPLMLETPLVEWLHSRVVRTALIVVGAILTVLSAVAVNATRLAAAPSVTLSPLAAAQVLSVYGLISAVMLFALVACLDAMRRAPRGSAARRKARAIAFSFGLRDALASVGLQFIIAGGLAGGPLIGLEQHELVRVGEALARLATVMAMPLLAYGILRTQLFDIDLHIRWGIRRGTFAAVFAVAFFIAFKLVESYLSRSLGWVAGGLAAGFLLFATPRLNKFADRVGEAALPGVQATPAYVAFRKLEVYKAAVESALETGALDQRERDMLAKLRTKLGLAAADALAVEADVAAAAATS